MIRDVELVKMLERTSMYQTEFDQYNWTYRIVKDINRIEIMLGDTTDTYNLHNIIG